MVDYNFKKAREVFDQLTDTRVEWLNRMLKRERREEESRLRYERMRQRVFR